MKIFSCRVTGFHPTTLLNMVSIIDVFLEIIRPFERQVFLRTVAKIEVFILLSVFHQAKVKNKNLELAEIFFTCFSENQTSLTSSKGFLKLLNYKCLLQSLVRICFYLEKEVTISIFHFRKTNFNLKKMEKRVSAIY